MSITYCLTALAWQVLGFQESAGWECQKTLYLTSYLSLEIWFVEISLWQRTWQLWANLGLAGKYQHWRSPCPSLLGAEKDRDLGDKWDSPASKCMGWTMYQWPTLWCHRLALVHGVGPGLCSEVSWHFLRDYPLQTVLILHRTDEFLVKKRWILEKTQGWLLLSE